ncbi:MAG: hypothetical protein MUP82_08935, partial [Candidatus Marinimicrobia bacterium]|nr:hypothetical protein [Candidatus Neomarinimicrobiota bacterium]
RQYIYLNGVRFNRRSYMALAKYFENYKKLVEAHQHIREAHKRFYVNWVELFLDYLKKIVLPKKTI